MTSSPQTRSALLTAHLWRIKSQSPEPLHTDDLLQTQHVNGVPDAYSICLIDPSELSSFVVQVKGSIIYVGRA